MKKSMAVFIAVLCLGVSSVSLADDFPEGKDQMKGNKRKTHDGMGELKGDKNKNQNEMKGEIKGDKEKMKSNADKADSETQKTQ